MNKEDNTNDQSKGENMSENGQVEVSTGSGKLPGIQKEGVSKSSVAKHFFYPEEDLRVTVKTEEFKSPPPNHVFDIAVIAFGKPGDDPKYKEIKGNEDLSDLSKILPDQDFKELKDATPERGFAKKPIHVFTINPKEFDLKQWGSHLEPLVKTIIFTSSVTDAMIGDPQKVLQMNTLFQKPDRFVFVLSYGAHRTQSDYGEIFKDGTDEEKKKGKRTGLINQNNICVFANPERDSKVVYTFASLLQRYPYVEFVSKIRNNNDLFHSEFLTPEHRDLMMSNKFSFWMQTSSVGTFCFDVYVGRKQVQSKYSYIILEHRMKQVITEWINQGQRYNDDSLLNLKANLAEPLDRLVWQGVMKSYDVNFQPVSQQEIEDVVSGIIEGFSIDFDEQYRFALINIKIGGKV